MNFTNDPLWNAFMVSLDTETRETNYGFEVALEGDIPPVLATKDFARGEIIAKFYFRSKIQIKEFNADYAKYLNRQCVEEALEFFEKNEEKCEQLAQPRKPKRAERKTKMTRSHIVQMWRAKSFECEGYLYTYIMPFIAHRCSCNAIIHAKSGVLEALLPIKKGEKIRISYVSANTAQERHKLLKSLYDKPPCNCPLCKSNEPYDEWLKGISRECKNCSAKPSSKKICAKCKQTWYCSKECQVEHWKIHKVVCHKITQTPL